MKGEEKMKRSNLTAGILYMLAGVLLAAAAGIAAKHPKKGGAVK